jgi:hypothetical protein
MSEMKILKVKLIKGGEKLELGMKESGIIQADDVKECKNPVHPDLSKAVQSLAVHLAILCDFIEPKQSKDEDEIEKFTVTGYAIGGKEGEEGVTITGMRKTKSGQKYSINSPFTRFEASDEARYILMGDLTSKIDAIEEEVKKYLFEGKMQQPSLFNKEEQEDAVTHMQIAGPKTEEERNDEVLNNLKSGKSVYANPEAMERVGNWDNPNDDNEDPGDVGSEKKPGKGGKKTKPVS